MSEGFIDVVFSWSLEDILNDELFKDQVDQIPDTFLSAKHYLGSFSCPLLEETRAEIASSLEIIQRAPFAEVVSIDESDSKGSLNYQINIDHWRNRYNERGKYLYRTLPGDILVISDSRPGTCSDLQRVGWKQAFAHVTEITAGENGSDISSSCFKVKVSRDIEIKEGSRKSFFVVFLRNVTTNKRIWNALHMYKNLDIINRVLSADSEVEEDCQLCCVRGESQLIENVGARLLSMLNQSQTEAILASLSRMKCNHEPTLDLIWGPPGSGKTKTISVLLFTLLKMNCRTLVCAPTNVAVNEVASRVLKLVKESSKSGSVKDALFCSLGDIVLFGNKDRLKFNSATQEINVEYRAGRLAECLGPLTGWRHCLTTMIDLLEGSVAQYEAYIENKMTKEKTQKGLDESLVEFVRRRFKLIAADLRRCLRKLCTHLPKHYILEDNFRNMETLVLCVDSMEKMLFKDALVSEELEKMFASQVAIEDFSESFLDNSSLVYVKSKCLSVSRKLQLSLEDLCLPNYMNKGAIVNFCFQNASLILCTASSSYMLHSVPMEAMKFLVVDEAAQLKECESLIPLQLPGLRHAILVGDECQLPAMVCSNISGDAGLRRSLFERLSMLGRHKHLLDMQYRMHPSISSFPNSKFYSNRISDAPLVKTTSYEKHYLPGPMFGPYSFINIVGGKEDVDDHFQHSRKNMVEVAIVVKLLRDLYREYKAWNGPKELSVGVISPYTAQVVAIRDKLGREYKNIEGLTVKVKSVDGFQGGEADVIIISTVRSSASNAIGFLSSPQRINVALTRARYCLWILGNDRTLTGSENIWKDLIRDAKDRHSFFNADEDDDIAKAILMVKKELNQLDDLFNEGSVLFKNAIWKVFFSDNFIKSFVKLSSSPKKKAVINLLLKLSKGWRPKKRNLDPNLENSSQILKQFKVEGLYVVCTIDIKKVSRSYTQILKVWDLLPLEEVPKLVKRLEGVFSMCTDIYINHCQEKCLKGHLEVPHSWVTSADIVQFKLHETDDFVGNESCDGCRRVYVENSRASESLLLMKFYWLSSGMVSHLLSDLGGEQVDLPFDVTDEQLEMILCSESTFILGRSGTGKTTVLTMKLLRREEQHYIALKVVSAEASSTKDLGKGNQIAGECIVETNKSERSMVETKESSLRQLFVTVSPRLCYAIKKNISGIKRFSSKTILSDESMRIGMDDTTRFEDLPDSFLGISPHKYPLVITFHKFLIMLDGTVGTSFFERYSVIRDFLHGKTTSSRSVALETFLRTKEVTYEAFCSFYWVHFNSELRKKLDPSRVFTEIISHIKGGLKEGRVCEGVLSREEYVLLSKGKASTLSEQIRERIYDIFQDYEKTKAHKCEFDLADLVNDLHCRLSCTKFEGHEMDFVYVDEVQDLTIRQIALFKYICRNVDEGFVFAGDTAQTIARGIDFRFQDIRSLFYNEFLMESKVSRPDGSVVKKNMSELLCLKQNFRTHDGVLKLAQSVIDLLYCFFPHIVDILDPEESLICGEEPILLEPVNGENAIMTIFGNGGSENVSSNFVGFGAEQVILVRDDVARKEISAYVGKQALVLTIVECKGLEFQDVLLYNFFGSSPLKNQWRVIYGYMEKHDILDGNYKSFPRFSQARHNVLCSELKQLYVAITRTRQRLWICENIEEFSKPMFDYWKKKSFVQVKKLDDSLAHAMQVASSPEEWKARGIKLFHEGNYEMATMCFERAGEVMWEKWSKAAGLRATAARMRDLNPEGARVILRQAAEIFDSIGKADSAAKCYYELGEFEKAGKVYLMNYGEDKLHKAGECFFLAGCYELAAEVYAKGHYVSECLSACSKGKLFETGLQYIRGWKQLDHCDYFQGSNELIKTEQSFLESCAHHYFKLQDSRSMMKFVKDFHTIDSVRYFLKTLKCFDELLLVEEELGNFIEASEIASSKGDFLLEAELLGKGNHFKDASMLMLWYVFANSLWVFNSKGWPLKPFSGIEEILAKAKSLAKKDSDSFFEFVSTEVSLLRQEECDLSQLNCYLNASRSNKSLRGEVLSIRKILDIHLHKRASKFEWEDELYKEDLIKQCENKLARNCVSVGTLTYMWNLLKEKIENIFKHLIRLETLDTNESIGYGEFCFNYFGVKRILNGANVLYLLMNSDAYWVKDIDERFFRKNGNSVYVNFQQFVFAVRNHFCSELLSVGFKLLDSLEELYKLAIKNSMSVFCQSTPLIHIFEVTKYLLESKDLNVKYHDAKKLQNVLDKTSAYFEYVFPLDWRSTLAENMISLRRSDISRRLLEEIGLAKIGLKGKPTYGELGRVAMILLGSGKPSKEFNEKILKIESKFPWKELFNEIGWKTDSEIPEFSSAKASSLHKFFRALHDAFNVDWFAYDYISPNCFFYLLEHLLLWSSFTREFFFTTKSSFVECIIGGGSYFNGTSSSGHDGHIVTKDMFDFLATKIEQFMFGRPIVTRWIVKSGLNFNLYYPLLLLRLAVTLCLLCANCGSYFHILSRFLKKDDLISWLPRDFVDVLRRKQGKNYLIMNANENKNILAEALMKIGDPLVIVSMSGNNCKFSCSAALFVDMKTVSCKENVLRILFPVKSKVLQGQDVEVEATKFCNTDNCCQYSNASSSNFVYFGEKITENDNQCKSGRIKLISEGKMMGDSFTTTRKEISRLKEVFQGYEALSHDDSQRLSTALDNGDLDTSISIMHYTMCKQIMLTGDPSLKAFMEERCNDDKAASKSTVRSKERNANSSKGQKNNNSSKNSNSENKGKGKEKLKKEKGGLKK